MLANEDSVVFFFAMCENKSIFYFPLALVFSVSPVLQVLGTTWLLLRWLTAHVPEVAGSASRWVLAVSGFHINPLSHPGLLPSFSCYLPQASCDNNAHTHTVTKHKKITRSTSSQVAKDGAEPPLTLWFKQGCTPPHLGWWKTKLNIKSHNTAVTKIPNDTPPVCVCVHCLR